jgi:enamine deaminase RidA (YjgF/YER057c/UK114 family)
MISGPEQRLLSAGYLLPPAPQAKGMYRTWVRHHDVVHLSAHGPFAPTGGFTHTGVVGEDLTVEEGKAAAAACALALLSSAAAALGTLDVVDTALTMRGYVCGAPGFTEQARVLDGASEVIQVALEERGRPVRTAVGAAALPFGLPVVVELSLSVRGDDG